jgi:hypothetical protein
MLRVIKSCLKDVAGKTRAETAVLYALFNGTLGNRASTPEHVALAQLTSWAIGFFPPCTSLAESTTSPNKVSIHLEILFCVCIPLQRPNGWHQRRRAAPSAACCCHAALFRCHAPAVVPSTPPKTMGTIREPLLNSSSCRSIPSSLSGRARYCRSGSGSGRVPPW